MKKYVVRKEFIDRFSKEYFPQGASYESADDDRIKHLQKLGFLGEELDPDDELDERLKPLGGGYYELPNGEKIRGKEKALAALKEWEKGEADENRGSEQADHPAE